MENEYKPMTAEESAAFTARYIQPAALKIRADIIATCDKYGMDGEKMLREIGESIRIF